MSSANKPSLWSLFFLFLKIGVVAFGGYLAIASVVEREVVERRKLLKNQSILDGLALALVLPGPVGANVVAYVGYELRGLAGALVSAVGLILPSFLLLLGFSELYRRYGEIPAVDAIFSGFLPAVVAIVLAVAWRLAKQTLKERFHYFVAILALGFFTLCGGFATALGLLVASGLAGILQQGVLHKAPAASKEEQQESPQPVMPAALLAALGVLGTTILWQFGSASALRQLWLSFSGMSLVMFGGGYVFIPMMKELVVHQHAWITAREFADAIALGQITPGPIMISATFIGYRVAGMLGAVVATIAIFGPSGMLMVLCSGLHQRVANSALVKAAYQGIRPCVVGLIVTAAIVLARTAEPTWASLVIFAAALVATIRYKLDTIYVLPLSGVVGYLLKL